MPFQKILFKNEELLKAKKSELKLLEPFIGLK